MKNTVLQSNLDYSTSSLEKDKLEFINKLNETDFKSPPLTLDEMHARRLQGGHTTSDRLKVAYHVFLIGPHGAAADGAL